MRLSSPDTLLAPRHATDAEKLEHYRRLLKAHGQTVPTDGEATVIGLRGLTSGAKLHDTTYSQKFDDVFVVLRSDGRVFELRGSTHPSHHNGPAARAATDADGDGVPDVGMLRPGLYEAKARGDYKGAPGYDVWTVEGSVTPPGWRDTSHDGLLSGAEKQGSEQRGDLLTGILFHHGKNSVPGSIGCQTIANRDYGRFVEAVGGAAADFHYVLLDAHSVVT
jgi:hypothetical protein